MATKKARRRKTKQRKSQPTIADVIKVLHRYVSRIEHIASRVDEIRKILLDDLSIPVEHDAGTAGITTETLDANVEAASERQV